MSPISKKEKERLRDSINDIVDLLAETEQEINDIPVNSLPPEADTSPETPEAIKRTFRESLRPHKKKISIVAIIFGLASIISGIVELIRELH